MLNSKKGLYTFWKNLRAIGKSRTWKKKMFGGQYIRLFDKDGNEYCPLTAVCYKLKKEYYDAGDANLAGDELNISKNNQNRIMSSADYNTYLDSYDNKTRKKMLKVLKLKEQN